MLTFRLLIIASLLTWLPTSFARADSALSLSDATVTLNQTFVTAPVWRKGGTQTSVPIKPLNDPGFNWAAGYIWDHATVGAHPPWPLPTQNFPAWTSNGAADADPNGDMNAKMGPQLAALSWSGSLNLTARPMPESLAPTIDKTDPNGFMGASITSFPYAQRYGIFAISAKLPTGHGLWPAFWLLPADKSWPPEIDVMEVVGKLPTTIYTTVHFNGSNGHVAAASTFDTKLDLSAQFHEYAVDWGPNTIKWYFDRQLIYTQQTPDSLHKPCYIIANLAVGKNPNGWVGAPDATTKFPATMHIAYIKAWQRPTYPK